MSLNRVTITGADDSVDPQELIKLSGQFPFVEWGILFSANRQGGVRFPSQDWINRFTRAIEDARWGVRVCSHLCGRHLVKDFCETGVFAFRGEQVSLWPHIQRVQLNFHSQKHGIGEAAIEFIRNAGRQFIVQYDGVNDDALKAILKPENPIVPLFDLSGGLGKLPNTWPEPVAGRYCGYAGGLNPENVAEQWRKIHVQAAAHGNPAYWMDMETGVRTEDLRELDLNKVKSVLGTMTPVIER